MKKRIEFVLMIGFLFIIPHIGYGKKTDDYLEDVEESSDYLGYEEKTNDSEDTKSLSRNTTQDLYVGTRLAKDNNFSPYLEVDLGYCHDTIKNAFSLNSNYYDVLGNRKQAIDFFQFNVRGGFRFVKYLFLRGEVGFGFFGKDTDVEMSFLKGIEDPINQYTKNFDDGYGFDGLIGGGVHIPIFKKHLAIDLEIGYDYKKIKVPDSLIVRISSPYAGGSFYCSPGYHIGVSLFGNYFFAPSMKTNGDLYFIGSDTYLPTPQIHTKHGITAYKVGATLSYLFYKHFSVSFDWEFFSASANSVTEPFGSTLPGTTYTQTLNYWHSNRYQTGIRYSF